MLKGDCLATVVCRSARYSSTGDDGNRDKRLISDQEELPTLVGRPPYLARSDRTSVEEVGSRLALIVSQLLEFLNMDVTSQSNFGD